MTASPPKTNARSSGARQLSRPLQAIVWGLALGLPALMVAALPLLPLLQDRDSWAMFAYPAVVSTWGVMGAVIVVRRPGNAVGWLLWVVGVGLAVSLVGQSWSFISAVRAGGTLPGTTVGAWLSWLFSPMLVLALIVPPLLFPDGRLMSRRWAIVLALAVAAAVGLALGAIVKPGSLDFVGFAIENPTGIPGLEGVGSCCWTCPGSSSCRASCWPPWPPHCGFVAGRRSSASNSNGSGPRWASPRSASPARPRCHSRSGSPATS